MKPVLYVPASQDGVRRLLRPWVKPSAWMTYRLPFQAEVRVTYPPTTVGNPSTHPAAKHELHHVRQFSHWWAPWVLPLLASVLPLPMLFSGRWFIERGAFLEAIRNGLFSVEQAVVVLWTEYGKPWPKCMMRRWFEAHR